MLADRVETTLSLKLERAQLAAERLEHRLHMLQTNVQVRLLPRITYQTCDIILNEDKVFNIEFHFRHQSRRAVIK